MTQFVNIVLFGLLITHLSAAAPSETKLDDIADVKIDDIADVNLENSKQEEDVLRPETLLHDSKSEEHDSTQGQRQKRWYNYYGFGLPPLNPVVYKRDDAENTGNFGIEDPFDQIHRRLQEISSFVRNPVPPPIPPPIPRFPSYFPVIFVPHVGCGCSPDNTPTTPEVTPAPPQGNDRNNETSPIPDIMNRWPEMEDERQNWGLVDNDTNVTDNGDDNDGARPISFEPIRPKTPMKRPPPPVEHGSSQGDINTLTTTTIQPPSISQDASLQPPNVCDSAVVSCCHMPQVTYDCFALQGCPDPSIYGNPCDPSVIVRVIERFQRYYNQKNG